MQRVSSPSQVADVPAAPTHPSLDYRDSNGPMHAFPPQPHPHYAYYTDVALQGQPPSRGASPSPASTFNSQANSLFSVQSTESSAYTHHSSSVTSFHDGRDSDSPAPGCVPRPPSCGPQPPFHRSQSRAGGSSRPGSPLSRHMTSINGSRNHSKISGVSRPASRRAIRLGSANIDHISQQVLWETKARNSPPPRQGQVQSLEACLQEEQRTSYWVEYTAAPEHGAPEGTTPPSPDDVDESDEGARLSPEADQPPESPTSQSSQDITMTGFSDVDADSPESCDSGAAAPERSIRVLKSILDEEFGLRLGKAEPPEDMVDAVSRCMDNLSLSRHRYRQEGFIVPINTFHVPGDSHEQTTPPETTSRGSGGKLPIASKKRNADDPRRDEGDGPPGEDGKEEGERSSFGPNDPRSQKRAKVELYPCPFRKHNPIKFNIREWEYCARAPFKGKTELKKHIIRYHQQEQVSFKCDRCLTAFPSREELKTHLRRDPDKMCETRSDREASPYTATNEGVSSAVGERLRSRSEHLDWTGIWLAVFPGYDPSLIPEPVFEPAVELHEVSRSYNESHLELATMISDTLGHESERLNTSMLNIFDQFMNGVFQRAHVQAAAGVGSSFAFNRRHLQSPRDGLGPFLRTNSGTPSSSTTSSSTHPYALSRTERMSTSGSSNSSTPALPLRTSQSRGSNPSPLAWTQQGGAGGYYHSPYRQSENAQLLVPSLYPNHGIAPGSSAPSNSVAVPQFSALPAHVVGQYTPNSYGHGHGQYPVPGQQSNGWQDPQGVLGNMNPGIVGLSNSRGQIATPLDINPGLVSGNYGARCSGHLSAVDDTRVGYLNRGLPLNQVPQPPDAAAITASLGEMLARLDAPLDRRQVEGPR
ncbi:hypothetical protein B0T26DRAFT_430558 [Lasiosphaeria miniovina]|uniref:C2H2-type domain-containing protein n=1 Tax=Lasiosphaeria miniovina TaxID=1954250 RepID=A0AA40DNR7_9PEZI|nr:uncharacterized protein B0T26DRAFT_430558 [Lasiosphaeria miniovina]KAK0710015.1 hypothetical protein B0T26DRAFT_430558 [Lasiosphaeria miniovina]